MSSSSASEGTSVPDAVEAIGGESSSGNIRRIQVRDGSADGLAASIRQLVAGGFAYLFNGTGWDRRRGAEERTLHASAQETANWQSADQPAHNHSSVTLFFDLTATGGTTPSVSKVAIQAKDPASGNYVDLVSNTSIGSTTGTYVLQAGPGLGDAGANLNGVNDVLLPRTWRAVVNVDTADGDETYTFSVAASLGVV